MELRAAVTAELPAIMDILAEGRMAQRRQGFVQWADGYPNRLTIAEILTTEPDGCCVTAACR